MTYQSSTKARVHALLQKEMDRKGFVTYVAATVVTLFGFSAILNYILRTKPGSQTVSASGPSRFTNYGHKR